MGARNPDNQNPKLGSVLLRVFELLRQRYGPQHWWPAEEPFEVIVGAILTQSTAWINVEKAIANLKGAGVLSPCGLLGIGQTELADLVYPAGYYNMKARKLKAFAGYLAASYKGELDNLFALDKETLRVELLSVYGIGQETADSIILYAAGKPVFVVDAYTRRLFSRLGIVAADAPYGFIQGLFHRYLPEDTEMFNEFHALIVTQGKLKCTKKPDCSGCCLVGECKYTKA